jgi:hypothetical protein
MLLILSEKLRKHYELFVNKKRGHEKPLFVCVFFIVWIFKSWYNQVLNIKLSRIYTMNTLNREVFAIVNADNTKILTEIGWIGLFLSQEAMTPEKVTEKLYGGVSLRSSISFFEQRADSTDYIQYYKSFDRAAEVLLEVSTRERSPITERMSIVKIQVNATASVTTMFDIKKVAEDRQKTIQLEQFEKAALQKMVS